MNRIFSFLIFSFSVCSLSAQTFLPRSTAGLAGSSSDVSQPQADLPKEPKDNLAIRTLNQLFNSDESNKNKILIINNDSDCDFTMNISGHENYIIPVAAGKTESIILKEGEYVLRSEICQSAYLSKKIISENMQVNIRHKIVTTPETPALSALE